MTTPLNQPKSPTIPTWTVDIGAPVRPRFDSIDLVRGLVMVIMALDHVKGNFLGIPFDPVDLTRTEPKYFLTRWITHFCAPTFVFLAGTGAFLSGTRGKTKPQLAWFLISRGLWLIFLELTVIRYSWYLNLTYDFAFAQVIWAIGWSMIVLAGLIFLSTSAITVFGLAMIIFHNLLDGVNPADWGDLQWLWRILHVGDQMPYTSQWLDSLQGWLNGKPFDAPQPRVFNPFYPLIPWIGVMAAGYGFGSLMLLEQRRRRRELLGLGISLVLLFVALRYTNFYGDKITNQPGQPGPWSVQEDWRFTVFSFVNCQKYPPSLLFLLMTIGPAIIGISHFDRENGPIGQFFVIFGRVPLFFYLLHWFLIKGLAIGFAYARFGRADWLYGVPSNQQGPEGSRYDLWVVYLVWVGVVLFLFPLCYWFAGVKRRSKAAWLSYS